MGKLVKNAVSKDSNSVGLGCTKESTLYKHSDYDGGNLIVKSTMPAPGPSLSVPLQGHTAL